MKKKVIAPYSIDELAELRDVHYQLVDTHVFNYRPGGAVWQRNHGLLADLSFAPVLRIVELEMGEGVTRTKAEIDELLLKIGAYTALAVQQNNADDIRRLAVVLEARRQGRSLASLTREELFLPPRRGRPATPHDLSRAFPLALIEVTRRRLAPHAKPDERTDARITRGELKNLVSISEQELSRWISKFNFGKYMAEQPIARKPRKTG